MLGILILAVLCVYIAYASHEFRRAYATYTTLVQANVDAAYVPGAENNPLRQHLNTVLSQVLARPMSAKERMDFAEEGLKVLKAAEQQIDVIGDTGDKVQLSITYMQEKARAPGAFLLRGYVTRILSLATEEHNITADIRGLSYRANFHTAEIFNRIVLDKGELTPAYLQELNRQVPAVEEQFNKRTGLYAQLKDVSARMQAESMDLAHVWWLFGGGEGDIHSAPSNVQKAV